MPSGYRFGLFLLCQYLDISDEIDILPSRPTIVNVLIQCQVANIMKLCDVHTSHPAMRPASRLRFRGTRTHFPLIASCSLVESGAQNSVPNVGSIKQRTTAISDTNSLRSR